MNKFKLNIILPTFHEEDNIEKVIKGIKKYVKTENIITIVIQDKKDPTIPVIRRLQKFSSNIEIIYTKDGKGMLKALRRGFENSKSPIIVITMADLSDDPRDIDKMAKLIDEGYDLVCASRYIKGGQHNGGPMIKGILSYLGCISLKFLIGLPASDATNAFKCFRASILDNIKIQSREGFEMPLELTIKAFYKGFKITEVPTVWRDREKGESNFRIWKNLQFYLRWYLFGIGKRLFN